MSEGQELLMLIGLPASGKTTWAKRFCAERPEYVRISNDNLRVELFGPGATYNPPREPHVTALRRQRMGEALAAGHSVVLDNMNMSGNAMREAQWMARRHGVRLRFQRFDVPIGECIRRDGLRQRPVGAAVIRQMADLFRRKGYA